MSDSKPSNRSPLLPDRHPIQDFFICDVTDAIPKDDMGSMEHPIFSLATKPDTSIREYEHNGVKLAVMPSALGLATIHDKDILIYCISQLMAALNDGRQITAEMVREIVASMLQRPGWDGGKFPQAAELFEQLSLSSELKEFLTLEAYRYL